jgi:hypothetical protein
MGLGASILIFAVGAILTFGVTLQPTGLNLDAIGVILMIVGAVGAFISALFWMSWSPYAQRTIVREGDYHYDHDHVHDHRGAA